jgi:histidinol-phosphate/aromatic aminotransferase/cobyric acid decarboxylase-like protein
MNQLCKYHGGSEIHDIPNLKQDMSVTTNAFGLSDNYFETMTREKFEHLATHYPPTGIDTELTEAYNSFVGKDAKFSPLFGNGASELIDVTIRSLPAGNWKTNNVATQYREYQNACIKTGRTQVKHDDINTAISIIINPNNPTGDFLKWDEIVDYIAKYVGDNSCLMIDESMLFWYGANWTEHSALGHADYIDELRSARNITVVVIQSWTKIFSCTGLRVGSAVIFDEALRSAVANAMPPWSLNAIGRDYILHAWSNSDYLQKTWKLTREYRAAIKKRVQELCPTFAIYGADFTSWLWIDAHDPIRAEQIVRDSKRIGFPIRHGKQGYKKDTFIRIAVRDPSLIAEWFDVLKLPFDINKVKSTLVKQQTMLPLSSIVRHEQRNGAHADSLLEYIQSYNAYIQTPAVCAIPNTDKYMLVDGHHRVSVLTRMGQTEIPVTVVDYFHPSIITGKNEFTKEYIIAQSLNGQLMPPKSTKHMVDVGDGDCIPIIALCEYIKVV